MPVLPNELGNVSDLERDHDMRVTIHTVLHHDTVHLLHDRTINLLHLESVTRSVSISVCMDAISDAVYHTIK